MLKLACRRSNLRIIETLLLDQRVELDANFFIWSIYNTPLVVFRRILQDDSVDPTVDGNAALKVAAQTGRHEMLEALLCHPRIDPAFDNCHLVDIAVQANKFDIVARLMRDARMQRHHRYNELKMIEPWDLRPKEVLRAANKKIKNR